MKRILLSAIFLAGLWLVAASPASAQAKAAKAAKNANTAVSSTAATPVETPAPTAEADAALEALTNRVSNLEKSFKVEVHGFVELNVFRDDTHSFTEVIGSGAVKKPVDLAGYNGWTQFSMRDSRLSFLATAPEIDGWKTKGFIEADFKGYDPAPTYASAPSGAPAAPSEAGFFSYPTFGLRHAYIGVEKDGFNILAGQFWTLFGWDMGYLLSTVSIAPLMGVMFERTTQVRVSKTMVMDDLKLQIAVSADRPEQRDSQVPNLVGGLKFSLPGWKGRYAQATGTANTVPFSLALSGTLRNYAWPQTDNPFLETNNVWGRAAAVQALIPLITYDENADNPSIVLTGECSMGEGYGDMFPNWSGGLKALVNTGSNLVPNLDAGIAGFDENSNFTLVQLRSWNGQVQVHLPKSWGTFLTAGYGELFSPNVGSLLSAPGGVSPANNYSSHYNDDACFFANIMQDVTSNIRVAVEYSWFDTHYLVSFNDGINDSYNNRIQFTSWYRF